MNTKTLSIKARVYNIIRTKLYKRKLESFTAEEKQQIFDSLFADNKEAHKELNNYKDKRHYKAEIQRLRAERGVVKKKQKQTKAAYLASQK